jgi:uncharacterized protein (TIGR02246 family)
VIAQDRLPYVNTRQDAPFLFFGSPTVMRSTGETTDNHFCLLEHLMMPPALASPYHVHHNEDEAFYILEGTVAFLCGDAWHVAGPGSWVYGPRDIPHGFRVIGTNPARMLLQCAPAGFERFVRELSVPIDGTPAAPDMALLVATAAKYGVDILGPLPEMPAPPPTVASTATMPLTEAVEQLRRSHMAAVDGGDAEAAAGLFAPDGVFLPPGQPAVEGFAAIRAWFARLFANVQVQDFGIQPAGVQTYGDALIEHGTWQAVFHPKNSAQVLSGGGTYVTIYARTANGNVAVIKDIFNGLPVL